MNLGQAKDKAIKIIKEYSNGGTVTSKSRNLDFLLPANSYFDSAQKLVATQKKISARYDIVQNNPDNGLGDQFDIVKHTGGTDQSYALETTASAYYFEVAGNATVYIEEETAEDTWTALSTITHTNTAGDGFYAYKGLITPSDTENAIRIRFGGSYYYNFRNFALFTDAFASAGDIPNYQPWQEHSLPTTFYKIDDVLLSEDLGRLEPTRYKFIENGSAKTILFPYDMVGEYQILYFKMPADIPDDPDDEDKYDTSYEFEIDIDAQEVMILYVCSLMLAAIDDYRSGSLLERYYVELAELTDDTVTGTESVTDAYGW